MSQLKVEYVAMSDLIPYARNSRTHSDEQVAQIAASIREFGFANPILIDADGGIIAGHGRARASHLLKLETVPCIRLANLTPTQRRAYVIADNRLALNAGWDADMLKLELQELNAEEFKLELLGFDADELVDFLAPTPGEGLTDPDAIPEKIETRCKPGQLWKLGKHRLLCGDSTKAEDVERLMGTERAIIFLTDPPYGVSYADKNAYLNAIGRGNHIQVGIENDHLNIDDTGKIWLASYKNAIAACDDKASFYIFSPQGGDLMMMMMIQESGWTLKHMLVWVKNNHVLGRCDYHYKHEPIFYGWNKTHKFYGGSSCFSILQFPKPMKNDLHPTMKPIALLENLITNSSQDNGLVLDLFLGSGSTMIACEKQGRRCFGVEVFPAYCDVILKRWEDFTGQVAVLDG